MNPNFNTARKLSIVHSPSEPYQAHAFSSVISKEELRYLRQMSPQEFERAFFQQLKSETKEVLRSTYFMKEAYRRREWSEEFSDFKRYCIFRLKMSETDFYRKYAIMKTLEEIPEIETKMLDGALSQATVSKTIQFIRRESRLHERAISTDEKRELFIQVENMTEKELEREFAILSPEAAKPDSVKQISESAFVRQFTSDQALENKLSRLKDLLAHTFQGTPTDRELFHKLADIALEKLDPKLKAERRESRKSSTQSLTKLGKLDEQDISREDRKPCLVGSEEPCSQGARTSIPAKTKHAVRARDQHSCSHRNPNGEKCQSTFALEIDHVQPVAQGGDNSIENLRLVCRTHNQLYAINKFGRTKMSEFIS